MCTSLDTLNNDQKNILWKADRALLKVATEIMLEDSNKTAYKIQLFPFKVPKKLKGPEKQLIRLIMALTHSKVLHPFALSKF